MSWIKRKQAFNQYLKQVNWYLSFGLFFLFTVLLGLCIAAVKLNTVIHDASALPIEAVAIKGERRFTSDKEIQTALEDLMQRSFFSADVNQVQAALESLPWVYQASVRREWPSTLKVYLVEQQAVAHWNKNAWLNIQGDVFEAPVKEGIKILPQLTGPNDEAKEVLETYQQVSKLLDINGFALTDLSLNPRHAWHAVLGNGIKLELGREDKMARIQRFINVFPKLEKQVQRVATVDLRYDTGLAVGWDDAHERTVN
ncbi:cell division protein FtsQ/DivIB [Shewanella surugensis]|uniref:Cell division protein FtsQ n=1 Tax=Shewanella surugensis TaxID=212020 RepID=A0ABT0L7C8_9GAMM|nr:FtsQ-type POTRA domain-containing protein [Shewanella surugensis]